MDWLGYEVKTNSKDVTAASLGCWYKSETRGGWNSSRECGTSRPDRAMKKPAEDLDAKTELTLELTAAG